jgi:uncharacterized tellurite resistance protein B-like protein
MLRTLQELFAPLLAPGGGTPNTPPAHTLELATAVLLVEVMRADRAFPVAERQHVLDTLTRLFPMADDERDTLMARAEGAAQDATDFHQFTSAINARWDLDARLRMVEAMWSVAFADRHLDAHERHVMWRLADLLHVQHAQSMAAKLRAQAAAGAEGGDAT